MHEKGFGHVRLTAFICYEMRVLARYYEKYTPEKKAQNLIRKGC